MNKIGIMTCELNGYGKKFIMTENSNIGLNGDGDMCMKMELLDKHFNNLGKVENAYIKYDDMIHFNNIQEASDHIKKFKCENV